MRRDWVILDHDAVVERLAKAEAALAAERAKVRELVECLSNVRALQEAIMNDRQSDLEFQHEQRCLARHAESLLRINTKALIEKYSKEEPNES